ncbi:MAG: insulinase family protein [Thermoleophilia bacterium]|nr:insulinase family protein [Thermoleophilia bacterium]
MPTDGYRLEQLSNGQRLVTEKLDHLRSVCMGFWIPAGSRDEPAGLVGTTHFIEHLLFKGSSRYTAEEIAQVFDTLGGELNASTSREYVVVYGRFLDDQLPVAMDVMADMLLTPAFSDLDREREVVLEEIAMVDDSPQDLIHDVLAEVVLDGHPLAHPILGTRESIAGASEEEIRAYHNTRFRFGDMVVAAAGNINHDELRELLLEHQGALDRGDPARVPSIPKMSPRRHFLSKETEQMHVCIGGVGLARDNERRYQLSVLDSLFGGSLSSRLFQEVREKRGLVYSVYSFSGMYWETGLTGLYFGCRPERLGAVMETVGRELVRLVSEPVPAEELQRAKEHLKGRMILGLESTSSRMSRLGKGVLTDTEILSLDELAERIESVTGEQVMELAAEVYSPAALSVVGIGSDEERFSEAVPEDCLAGLG